MKTRRGTHQVTLKAGTMLSRGLGQERITLERNTQVQWKRDSYYGERVYNLFGKWWRKV